jgi:hypothetical protein
MNSYGNRLAYATKRITEMGIYDFCDMGTIQNIAQTLSGGQFLGQIEKYLENRRKAAFHAVI